MNQSRLLIGSLFSLSLVLSLAGCAPPPPTVSSNQLPEAGVRLTDGTSLSAAPYVSPTQDVVFVVGDSDGTVVKLLWELDKGGQLSRSGEFGRAEVRSNVPYQLPVLNGGAHTLILTVTDDRGGIGTSITNFKVDSVAPTLTSVSVNGKLQPSGASMTYKKGDVLNLAANATDGRGAGDTSASVPAVSVALGDTPLRSSPSGTLSFDIAPLLTSTVNPVKIVATDSAGNTSAVYTLTFSQ